MLLHKIHRKPPGGGSVVFCLMRFRLSLNLAEEESGIEVAAAFFDESCCAEVGTVGAFFGCHKAVVPNLCRYRLNYADAFVDGASVFFLCFEHFESAVFGDAFFQADFCRDSRLNADDRRLDAEFVVVFLQVGHVFVDCALTSLANHQIRLVFVDAEERGCVARRQYVAYINEAETVAEGSTTVYF